MKILGNFTDLKELGEGGYGIVYGAKDKDGKDVALKTVKNEEDQEIVETIQREYRYLKKLDHPNIVKVYDFFYEEGVHFFSMELLEGQDLHSIRNEGKIDLAVIADYIMQVAKAIEAIDYACLVHRDIKPENMFLTNEGNIKLLDFGLIYDPLSIHVEKDDDMFGTPYFMAPEYIAGENDLTVKYDIYSLGVSFFFLLEKRYPFVGKDTQEVLKNHMYEELEKLNNVPDWVNDLLQMMTNKNPTKRPSPELVISLIKKGLEDN
jgi:eukaryotic-like serine/threonine-protein kinase